MVDLKIDILSYMNIPPFPVSAGELPLHFSDIDKDVLQDAIDDLLELRYIENINSKKKPMYVITLEGIAQISNIETEY